MFQTIHPTLVIKSVPQFWHKGVGKANHVIETEEKERREMTRVRAQVVAKAPGGVRVAVLVI